MSRPKTNAQRKAKKAKAPQRVVLARATAETKPPPLVINFDDWDTRQEFVDALGIFLQMNPKYGGTFTRG